MLQILLALVAAFLFAVGTVFQQKGAMEETGEEALKAGFLLKLVRKPVWLLGLGGDALGYAAQAAALGIGRIVVVQPLIVSSVVFALPLGARFTGQRVGKREMVGAAAVVIGLAAFTAISDPSGGVDDATDRGWIVAGLVSGAAATVLFVLALGRRPGVKAALLGTASGVLFGYVAPLTKATVDRFDDGIVAVVADWHVYGLIGASIIGFSLTQSALQTGALAPALSTTMSFETIVGVVLGLTILDEKLHDTTAGVIGSVVALVVALAGLLVLAGSEGAAEAKPALAAQTPP
jgi:drug/metabolite transporter (DMT)-like permease